MRSSFGSFGKRVNWLTAGSSVTLNDSVMIVLLKCSQGGRRVDFMLWEFFADLGDIEDDLRNGPISVSQQPHRGEQSTQPLH